MDKIPTIEETIAAMERGGWRLSSLSLISHREGYSCILERTNKKAEDSRTIYAFNSQNLEPTATEAIHVAWQNAREMNSRVVVNGGGVAIPQPTLDQYLSENLGLAMQLEDAVKGLRNLLMGVEDDEDAFL